MKKIWRIDQGYKGVSIKENELAIGLGHRRYPGYEKKNFISEIRALGVKAHDKISYSQNPFKVERKFCIVTDNYFKVRFIWIFVLLFILRVKTVAVLLEPVEIKSWTYTFVKKFRFFFELIVTHDQETLKYFSKKSIFLNISAPTIMPTEFSEGNRKYLCVYLYNSRKEMTEGHRVRRDFFKIAESYGAKCQILSTKFMLDKADFLPDTYFAVIIQNSRKDWYFSDMLLDCFACGVIPIYYGSSGYLKIFNGHGVIEIDSLRSLDKVLSDLSIEDYYSRLDAVKSNFDTVKKYYDIDSVLIDKIEDFIKRRETKE